MSLALGVDFDNTVVSYDGVMHTAAVGRGLIGEDVPRSKSEIREHIRRLPEGETHWRRLQALAYGPMMGEARLQEGVRKFFDSCKRRGVPVDIISHKTELAAHDETGTNLRTAAMKWMKDQRFFERDGLGLLPENVHFEPTRLQKLERIATLECTHFVDDLVETFQESAFPPNIERILFSPNGRAVRMPGVKVVGTWTELDGYLFDAGG